MEEHSKSLKKCLADIENGLTEQLNIMEESLMSSDSNCCRALYEHQINTMDEMFELLQSQFQKVLPESIQSS